MENNCPWRESFPGKHFSNDGISCLIHFSKFFSFMFFVRVVVTFVFAASTNTQCAEQRVLPISCAFEQILANSHCPWDKILNPTKFLSGAPHILQARSLGFWKRVMQFFSPYIDLKKCTTGLVISTAIVGKLITKWNVEQPWEIDGTSTLHIGRSQRYTLWKVLIEIFHQS